MLLYSSIQYPVWMYYWNKTFYNSGNFGHAHLHSFPSIIDNRCTKPWFCDRGLTPTHYEFKEYTVLKNIYIWHFFLEAIISKAHTTSGWDACSMGKTQIIAFKVNFNF